jgi:hypothetical protein
LSSIVSCCHKLYTIIFMALWEKRFKSSRKLTGAINNFYRDFYFRAPGSLVVLSFPQPFNFSSVFPSL